MGVESFCENVGKKEKKKLESENDLTDDCESMNNDFPLKKESSKNKSYPFEEKTSISKLEKLNENYGLVSKNLMTGRSTKTNKVKQNNICHLSNKELKDQLDKIKVKTNKEKE